MTNLYASLLLAVAATFAAPATLDAPQEVATLGPVCNAPAGWTIESSRTLALREDLAGADWIMVARGTVRWNASRATPAQLAAHLEAAAARAPNAQVIVQSMAGASCAQVNRVTALISSTFVCTPQSCFLTAQNEINPPPPPDLDD